ncbi:hypothetical protein GCM10009619_39100 [Williamsia maris]
MPEMSAAVEQLLHGHDCHVCVLSCVQFPRRSQVRPTLTPDADQNPDSCEFGTAWSVAPSPIPDDGVQTVSQACEVTPPAG